MIYNVEKVSDTEFIINGSIQVSNFEFKDRDIIYDINFDDNSVTEKEAIEIAEKFFLDALKAGVE